MGMDGVANVKAIIFDMDGVLIDSEPRYLDIFEEFFAQNGRKVSREAMLPTVGSSNRETWRIFAQLWGDGCDPQWLKEHFYSTGPKGMLDFGKVAFPGMVQTLRCLKARGLALYIASASAQPTIERMMRQTGIESYISGAVSGETVRRSKPFPDVYLQAIALSGFSAEECIAVEDSTYGIQAAKNAQLRVVGVHSDLAPSAQSEADFKIDTVAQLPELLFGAAEGL